MSDEIVFYTSPMSRGRIAHWMLEEVGAPYRIELISIDKRENKTPEFLAINPMGKLPVIVHRGTVVTEVAAICTYLADAFPDAKLAPATTEPARGTYLRWMFFGAGCFEPAVIDRMLARPPTDRTSAVGYGTYDDTLNTLEQALAPGPWILGDRFTAADVYLGSQIGWGLMVKTVEPRPAFLSYLARCQDRPAMQRMIVKTAQLTEEIKARG